MESVIRRLTTMFRLRFKQDPAGIFASQIYARIELVERIRIVYSLFENTKKSTDNGS